MFGVKDSLVREFTEVDDPAAAAQHGLPNPFRRLQFDVTLAAATG